MPHSLGLKPAVPLPGAATFHPVTSAHHPVTSAHHTVTSAHHTVTSAHHTVTSAHRKATSPLPLHQHQHQYQCQYQYQHTGSWLTSSQKGTDSQYQGNAQAAFIFSSNSSGRSSSSSCCTSRRRLRAMGPPCTAQFSGDHRQLHEQQQSPPQLLPKLGQQQEHPHPHQQQGQSLPHPQQQQQQQQASPSLRSCVDDNQQGQGQEEGEGGGARTVVSFYKFADLSADSHDLRSRLHKFCGTRELDGFILVAQEGINGSICGSKAEVDALFAWLEADARLEGLRRNYTPVENLGQSPAHSDPYSHSHPHSRRRTPSPPRPSMHPDEPFRREGVRVRHKAEIVTMGVPDVSPIKAVGTYVSPREWNDLISDPDTLVIDVRNSYETRLGRFKGALDPRTQSFRDFPSWVQSALLRHRNQTQEAQEELQGEPGERPSFEGSQEVQPSDRQRQQGVGGALSGIRVEPTPFHDFHAWVQSALMRQRDEGEGGGQGKALMGHLRRTQSAEMQSAELPEEMVCAAAHQNHTVTQGRDTVTQGRDSGARGSGGRSEAGWESDTGRGGGSGPRLQKVAMYCTGGIRCEKATSLMLSLGFQEVYHLEGGILSYLRDVPESQSLWEGECFVFDKRVAVRSGLARGSYRLCFACKEPVGPAEMQSPLWEEGVSCPRCYGKKSEAERARARARHMQYLHWGRVGGPIVEPQVTGDASRESGKAKSRLHRAQSL